MTLQDIRRKGGNGELRRLVPARTSRKQQRRVLERVANGERLFRIAIEMGLKRKTLEKRLWRGLYAELGATTLAQAVAEGLRQGVIK